MKWFKKWFKKKNPLAKAIEQGELEGKKEKFYGIANPIFNELQLRALEFFNVPYSNGRIIFFKETQEGKDPKIDIHIHLDFNPKEKDPQTSGKFNIKTDLG
jgi:hypothetical protein